MTYDPVIDLLHMHVDGVIAFKARGTRNDILAMMTAAVERHWVIMVPGPKGWRYTLTAKGRRVQRKHSYCGAIK